MQSPYAVVNAVQKVAKLLHTCFGRVGLSRHAGRALVELLLESRAVVVRALLLELGLEVGDFLR